MLDQITAFLVAHMTAIATVGPVIFEVVDRMLPTAKPSGLVRRIANLMTAIANAMDSAIGNNVKAP